MVPYYTYIDLSEWFHNAGSYTRVRFIPHVVSTRVNIVSETKDDSGDE